MAADDTTPADPMFKSVPRRPRSAAAASSAYAASSSPPPKEDPDSVSNNASLSSTGGGGGAENVPRAKKHRLEVPIEEHVPRAKKHRLGVPIEEHVPRAKDCGVGDRHGILGGMPLALSHKDKAGGASEHVPRANKKHRLAPIEEPEPKEDDAKDRGVGALDRHGILGGKSPALLSHKAKASAAASAASSASSTEAEPAVDWAENERCLKGKMPLVNEDDDADACVAVARRPLAGSRIGKLLGDAIRSHGSTAAAGFQPPSSLTKPKKPGTKPKKRPAKKDRTKRKKEKPTMKDSGAWFWCATGRHGISSAGSDADYSFDRIGIVSDRLRTTLRGLGVAAPVRVYGRFLTRCDRAIQQTRLLMSAKRWRAADAEFPVYAFLTEEEKKKVKGEGLPLTTYDRGGDAYELTFKFLKCNEACRLIYNWSKFLRHNGLVVDKDGPAPAHDDVMLDLWMFRTPRGEVGMVMLHYRRGDAAHADAGLDEVEQKRLLKNGDADDAVMEGDANEEGEEDAGLNGEVAAAAPAPAPAPSTPPSEPSGGGGGAIEATEEQAGALAEEAVAPSTSPEQHGGAGRSDEVTTPLSLGCDGTEEEEQEAGGGSALIVMVLEVEAAAQSSLDSNAGGAANEVAVPPSPPEAGGGAAMMATEDDEAAAELAAAAAALSWNVTKYEFEAALGLLMLSHQATSLREATGKAALGSSSMLGSDGASPDQQGCYRRLQRRRCPAAEFFDAAAKQDGQGLRYLL